MYAGGSEGVFSVTRTGTGLWTVKLQDNYQRILHVYGVMSVAGGASNIISVTENSTITNLAAANGSVIGVGLQSATATLADPVAAATTLVRLFFILGDATEP